MDSQNTVGYVFTCIDARHWKREAEFIPQVEKLLGVGDVFPQTIPGPDGAIINPDRTGDYEALMRSFEIIREHKGATVYAVIGHYECAGHQASDEQHREDTLEAAKKVAGEIKAPVWALILRPNVEGEGPTWILEKLDDNPMVS